MLLHQFVEDLLILLQDDTAPVGPNVTDTKEVIDSALLDALDNPRERMNVLKYEDRIFRFAQST